MWALFKIHIAGFNFGREDFDSKFSATHTGPGRPLEIALVCFVSQEP